MKNSSQKAKLTDLTKRNKRTTGKVLMSLISWWDNLINILTWILVRLWATFRTKSWTMDSKFSILPDCNRSRKWLQNKANGPIGTQQTTSASMITRNSRSSWQCQTERERTRIYSLKTMIQKMKCPKSLKALLKTQPFSLSRGTLLTTLARLLNSIWTCIKIN